MSRRRRDEEPFNARIVDLPCDLTPEEVSQRAIMIPQRMDEAEKVEKDLAEAKADAKGKLERINGEMDALARQVRTRQETRRVEVKDRKNFDDGTLETFRTDTGEVVGQRPLTDDDRQVSALDMGDAGAGEV